MTEIGPHKGLVPSRDGAAECGDLAPVLPLDADLPAKELHLVQLSTAGAPRLNLQRRDPPAAPSLRADADDRGSRR